MSPWQAAWRRVRKNRAAVVDTALYRAKEAGRDRVEAAAGVDTAAPLAQVDGEGATGFDGLDEDVAACPGLDAW